MRIQETRLPGVFIIDIDPIEDERGFFAQGWDRALALSYGIEADFERANISYNRQAGTLRGLHRQVAPYEEAKLVRCIQGRIFDVAVDVRPGSATFRQWVGVELTAENHRALYIPKGLLHGFQTLTPDTTVFYQVAGSYAPQAEAGARYDDPAFGIEWPKMGDPTRSEPVLSEKDEQWPGFAAFAPQEQIQPR